MTSAGLDVESVGVVAHGRSVSSPGARRAQSPDRLDPYRTHQLRSTGPAGHSRTTVRRSTSERRHRRSHSRPLYGSVHRNARWAEDGRARVSARSRPSASHIEGVFGRSIQRPGDRATRSRLTTPVACSCSQTSSTSVPGTTTDRSPTGRRGHPSPARSATAMAPHRGRARTARRVATRCTAGHRRRPICGGRRCCGGALRKCGPKV